jgi:hypothetical protein
MGLSGTYARVTSWCIGSYKLAARCNGQREKAVDFAKSKVAPPRQGAGTEFNEHLPDTRYKLPNLFDTPVTEPRAT